MSEIPRCYKKQNQQVLSVPFAFLIPSMDFILSESVLRQADIAGLSPKTWALNKNRRFAPVSLWDGV